jgi:hypothetical protein
LIKEEKIEESPYVAIKRKAVQLEESKGGFKLEVSGISMKNGEVEPIQEEIFRKYKQVPSS